MAGDSAWEHSDIRNASYLHNYLPDMPELNLRNKDVRQNILVSMIRLGMFIEIIFTISILNFAPAPKIKIHK